MKTYIDFIMGTILLLSVSSCTNSQHRAAELAKSHLEQSADNPKQLKIISISDPDSVFWYDLFYRSGAEEHHDYHGTSH
jgi:hypothetical protein